MEEGSSRDHFRGFEETARIVMVRGHDASMLKFLGAHHEPAQKGYDFDTYHAWHISPGRCLRIAHRSVEAWPERYLRPTSEEEALHFSAVSNRIHLGFLRFVQPNHDHPSPLVDGSNAFQAPYVVRFDLHDLRNLVGLD